MIAPIALFRSSSNGYGIERRDQGRERKKWRKKINGLKRILILIIRRIRIIEQKDFGL